MYFKRIFIFVLIFSGMLFASDGTGDGNITHHMTIFMFQLGIIIFLAKVSGMLFEKLKLPGTLGEIIVGIIAGPYLLGSFPLPFIGFDQGIFPLGTGSIPISTELYGISVIASVLLLFVSGLETDLKLLLRYLGSGGAVGAGGVIFSFFPGVFIGMYFLDKPFMSPECLFLGIMSTATSVGITAMILSKNKYMESPEGVTILSAAIIDDVIGIIILSVVMGIATVLTNGGVIDWGSIGYISAKALIIWLGLTVSGLIFADKISAFLKKFENKYIYSSIALGMALFLAGVFEKAGLAMIIGAYITGLSLSKTDISYEIQESLHPIKEFLVPVFFVVMGMLVNVKSITLGTLTFAVIYSIVALLAKVFGCGIPALLTGFNTKGALRIGLGMMPRGEVGLIIAGIGLSNGFINQDIYGVAILMVLSGIIVTPSVLNYSLKIPGSGNKRKQPEDELESYTVEMKSYDQSEILIHTITDYFDKEGYFISRLFLDYDVYQIRKDNIFIKLIKGSKKDNSNKITIITKKEDIEFVKELVFEASVTLEFNSREILRKINLKDMKKDSRHCPEKKIKINYDLSKILDPRCVILELKAVTKEGAVRELVDIMEANNKITDKEAVFRDVFERENVISTGMTNGIAIPHARSSGIESTQIAIGIKHSGIDFDSLDGHPSKIIILLVSSTKKADPHIKILAAISAYFHKKNSVRGFITLESAEEIVEFFKISTERSGVIKKIAKKLKYGT